MGYDITAITLDELSDDVTWKDKDEVAYHRTYMGGFRMLREQGYDRFLLINAESHDHGVSGDGNCKLIKLSDLKVALRILESHKPTRLANSGFNNEQDRDEFSSRKPFLKKFMEKCIKWCDKNNKEKILIYFG